MSHWRWVTMVLTILILVGCGTQETIAERRQRQAVDLCYKGYDYLKAKDTKNAEAQFKEALELDPFCDKAREGLAMMRGKANTAANTLVDEGNAALQKGNALAGQAGGKYTALFAEANLNAFPGNRGKLEQPAKEIIDLLRQAAEQFRAAAAKFEEATQQPADSKVVEYWKLQAQMCRKFADSKEAFARVPAVISDPSVQNANQLNEKAGPLIDAADKLDKESKEIAAAAEKHKEANKSKFK